jgi:hypothetical protein
MRPPSRPHAFGRAHYFRIETPVGGADRSTPKENALRNNNPISSECAYQCSVGSSQKGTHHNNNREHVMRIGSSSQPLVSSSYRAAAQRPHRSVPNVIDPRIYLPTTKEHAPRTRRVCGGTHDIVASIGWMDSVRPHGSHTTVREPTYHPPR